MKHFASPSFWEHYQRLSPNIQELANKNYELLKQDPNHPSLHFKQIRNYFSVRVGLRYRALGIQVPEGVLWFWIGSHADYDNLVYSRLIKEMLQTFQL